MAGLTTLISMTLLAGPVFDPGPVRADDGDTPQQIEVARIQRHLRQVERSLRANTPLDLAPEQRAARGRLLDSLHDYWTAGQFPKNRDYPDRRLPYFIDAEGVACAVGHLMIESDGEHIAREIATYENHDFVADIDHPEVGDWLQRNGLTAQEAAWIQPTYGPCGFEGGPLVCGIDGNTYLCENIAVNCAGTEVAHEGACGTATEGGSDSSGGTTGGDPGPVIGEEICTSATGDDTTGPAATDSGGATEAGDTAGATGTGAASTGTNEDEDGGDVPAEEDDKGCGCTSGRSSPTGVLSLLLLGVLGLRRRRR